MRTAKRLTIVMILVLGVASSARAAGKSTWKYNRLIMIEGKNVEEELKDFPVLVSLKEDALKDARNGGHVAQGDGGDIVFTLANSRIRLAHEIEKYSSDTGELIVWVKVPSVSRDKDTRLIMRYGNARCPDQWNVPGTWGDHYEFVHHLQETGGEHLDSTSNKRVGKPLGKVKQGVAGKIGDADLFDGEDDGVSVSSSGVSLVWTLEGWFYPYTIRDGGRAMLTLGGATVRLHEVQGAIKVRTGHRRNHSTDVVARRFAHSEWTHIAMTYDGTNLRGYRNGKLSMNIVKRIVDDIRGGVRIGQGLYNPFAGKIDEVRLSSVVRSSAWIKACYENQSDPSGFCTVGKERVRKSGAK